MARGYGGQVSQWSNGAPIWSKAYYTTIASSAYRWSLYPDNPLSINSAQSGVTANSLMFEPFRCPSDITLIGLGVRVNTAVASSTIRLGIVEIDETFTPTSLIVDAGTVDSSTTGFKSITGLSASLRAGKLYAKMRVTTSTGLAVQRVESGSWGLDWSTGHNVIRELYRSGSSAEASGFSNPPGAPNSGDAGSHTGFFHTILMRWS